jgi:hypothetical protein
MRWIASVSFFCVLVSGCASQSESLQLGGVTGFLTGAISMTAAQATSSGKVGLGKVLVGGEIGAVVGAVVSYFIHRSVEGSRRLGETQQPNLYFGDLPPSPFEQPKRKLGVSK